MEIKKYFKQNNLLYNIFKPFYRFYVDVIICDILGIIFRIFPIKSNKIVACSYYGKSYGDNPKYIIEELRKCNKFDIVWALNENYINYKLPSGVRPVKYGSIKYLYELCTAKVWIDNSRKNMVPIKRNSQYYIQTWHGGIGIKQVEKDAESSLPRLYCKRARIDSKNADLFLSNSKWLSNLYRTSFWYDGEILECGMPNNDILINEMKHKKIKEDFYKKIKIDQNINLLLYAPTFRNNNSVECYNIDLESILSKLEKTTGKKWGALVRLHPNIEKLDVKINYNKRIINVTSYPDLNEIMISSSMLITDYSSVMFMFGYSRKPVFMFTTDIVDYTKDRGFNFEFKELPFPICCSNKELIHNIETFDTTNYICKLDKFYSKVGLNETGNSAHETAKIIMKVCGVDEK